MTPVASTSVRHHTLPAVPATLHVAQPALAFLEAARPYLTVGEPAFESGEELHGSTGMLKRPRRQERQTFGHQPWQRGDLALYGPHLVRLSRPLYPQADYYPYGHERHGKEFRTSWVVVSVTNLLASPTSVGSTELQPLPGTEAIFAERRSRGITEETFGGAPAVTGSYLPGWHLIREFFLTPRDDRPEWAVYDTYRSYEQTGGEDSARTDAHERLYLLQQRMANPAGLHRIVIASRETRKGEAKGEALYFNGFLVASTAGSFDSPTVAAILRELLAVELPDYADEPMNRAAEVINTLAARGWSWEYRTVNARSFPHEEYDLEGRR